MKAQIPLKIIKKYGGAAIEYIIISTFAAAISVAAIGFIAKVFKSKLTTMSEKLDVPMSDDELNLENIISDEEK